MNIKLNSSEKSEALIQEKKYIHSHVGWAVFNLHLFYGKIMYRIAEQSKEKLQNIKQKITDLKVEINSTLNKLNSYNSTLDYDGDYENSNLKQRLDECEQAYIKASDYINLGKNNYWIQKF